MRTPSLQLKLGVLFKEDLIGIKYSSRYLLITNQKNIMKILRARALRKAILIRDIQSKIFV
jgi:hypothetical protein